MKGHLLEKKVLALMLGEKRLTSNVMTKIGKPR